MRAFAIIVALWGSASTAHAACDPEWSRLIGGVKCNDTKAGTWHQLEARFGCEERKGKTFSVLQLREKGPEKNELRKSFPAPRIKDFVLREIGKGRREPVLFSTTLPGGTTKVKDPCNKDTRREIFAMSCGDYGFKAELYCRKYFGIAQPHLAISEINGKRTKLRKSINPQQSMALNFENRGKTEAKLWKGKAGKKGEMEAFALLNPTNEIFEYVRFRIAPHGREECKRVLDMRPHWVTKWEGEPRRGYLEALGIPTMDASYFAAVHLRIVPLEGEPCERTIDVTEAWRFSWE